MNNILKDKYDGRINNNKSLNQIKEFNNGRYEGEIKNDKREGKGIFFF